MSDITVDLNGNAKLLNKLNVHKASGPDGQKAMVLKERSSVMLLCWHTFPL